MTPQADIGLIGLAVMGQNLVLNMNDHGFVVAVFNRTVSKVDDFLQGSAAGTKVIGAHSMEAFFHVLKRPRKVMLMVKAGAAVDELIAHCLPYLEEGDILIDGGNSNFEDTNNRVAQLKRQGIVFLGVGISGGEEGARHGPSIMPGGNIDGWQEIKQIFQAIAAKANNEPCCDWVGEGGAGHYVKMVHNGIEYGDMQLICETYDLLHRGLGLSGDAIADIFSQWNQGKLDSYLIEITSHILRKKEKSGAFLVDKILDAAGQKGTGKWTVINACNLGQPLTLITEAVFARNLSAMVDTRKEASTILGAETEPFLLDKDAAIAFLGQALYASKIVSYAQGFMLMRTASEIFKWNLAFGAIALMWRGGCIIRSAFLGKIKEAFDQNQQLKSLLLAPYFVSELNGCHKGWRTIVAAAAQAGIPMPCMSSALAFYDGLRCPRLPANLLQAQRDYFGAHTYERTDTPRGQFFHTEWSEPSDESS